MLPLISVVVPNLNGMEHLPECFASLHAASYPAARQEWILSDNGSTDGSVQFIERNYGTTRIVQNGGNIGFAPGCNNGAAAARGDYVVFLNNDTRVDRGWLDGFLAVLAKDPAAICAAAHMLTWDGRADDFSGASMNLFGVGRQRSIVGWPDCPRGPREGDPLLFACGGAMIVERKVFLAAGGFDPSFFIYFEDVDFGWRLWVLGHKVVYAPGAVVYHKGGGTSGESRASSHRRYLLFETNTLSAIFKNYSQPLLDRVMPAALLLELQRGLLSSGAAINREHYRLGGTERSALIEDQGVAQLPPISVAHLLSLGRLIERLPRLSAERARIQAARRRDDAEILPLFGWPFQPQFAGAQYANVARAIAAALDLYPAVAKVAPNRLLLLAPASGPAAARAAWLAEVLAADFHVALAKQKRGGWELIRPSDGAAPIDAMMASADAVIAFGAAAAETARLPENVALAVDVGEWKAADTPRPVRDRIARAASLVICAGDATRQDWQQQPGLRREIAVQRSGGQLNAALLRFCRYPIIAAASNSAAP